MIVLKPHEFRELVNDIRKVATICMNQHPVETDNLWVWLTRQDAFKYSGENLYQVFCTCKAYYNTQSFRERIIGSVKKAGVSHE